MILTTWRVRRGIRFLDENVGRETWLDRVDVDTLDVRRNGACPLAQATADYFWHSARQLGFQQDSRVDDFHLAALGFMNLPGEPWGGLTAAWWREVTALQRERACTLAGVG